MALLELIKKDINLITNTHGTSLNVYNSPSYSFDDEGKASITKGTATALNAVIFEGVGEELDAQIEVVDTSLIITVYIDAADVTLNTNAVISYNSEYYKIVYVDSNPIDNTQNSFYRVVAERIQPQSAVT